LVAEAAAAQAKEDVAFRQQWSAESKRRAAALAAEVMASKEWYYRPKGWKSGKTEPDPAFVLLVQLAQPCAAARPARHPAWVHHVQPC
jgi:hypothetical protein